MFPEELLAQFVTCPRCGHGNKFQTHRNGKAAQGSVAVVELPPVQVAELPSPSATAPTPAETAVNGSNRAMDRSQAQSPAAPPAPMVEEPAVEAPISAWSLVALLTGTTALLSPWLFDSVPVTKWLGCASVVLGGLALLASLRPSTNRRAMEDASPKYDLSSNLLALFGGVAIWLLASNKPGILKPMWELSLPVKPRDMETLFAVPAVKPREEGRQIGADEWVDAAISFIRQDDLIVAIDSVASRPLRLGKGMLGLGKSTPAISVHLRLANLGSDVIPVQGFALGAAAPVLTDDSGQSYPFLEARRRVPDKQRAVFDPKASLEAELAPTMMGRNAGYLLIFERAGGGSAFDPCKLEVPAALWGRKGTCRFRLEAPFERTAEGVTKQ